MTYCQYDRSPMRVVTEAPEFVVLACEAACHHLRVGAEPPPVRPGADPVLLLRGRRPPKPAGICVNSNCRRPSTPPFKQCDTCRINKTRNKIKRRQETA